MDKTFTYSHLEMILNSLKFGRDGEPGLAYRPLPVGTILFPLRRFVKEAEQALKAYVEIVSELRTRHAAAETDEEKDAINAEFVELQKQEVVIHVPRIPISSLEGVEGLTLADLMNLDPLISD